MNLIMICVFSFQLQNDTKTVYMQIFDELQISPQQAILKVRELGLTPFSFGQALVNLGPEKALAWFNAMEEADLEEINSYRYGSAWVHYTEQNIPRSEKELRTIVIKNPTDPLLNARIAFLWGHIELSKGNLKKADTYFDESLDLYNKEGRIGGKTNCMYGKGRVALLDDRLADAQSFFDKAAHLDLQRTDGKIAHEIHLGNAVIKMSQGNYQQALSLLELALSTTPSEEHQFIQIIQINMALCYAHKDNLVKASEIALTVDKYLDFHGGKQNIVNVLVSITWYLIYKKKGWPTEGFEEIIEDWIDNHKFSFEVERLFRIVRQKA